MKIIRNVWEKIDEEIRISIEVLFWAAFLVMGLSFGFYLVRGIDFWGAILVEAHGMLLNIFVFGILLIMLNKKRSKRSSIEKYKDEIDDFRDWHTEEAAFRIRGNIRRLNQRGVHKIDLRRCFLQNMDLTGVDLRGSKFSGATLTNAILRDADLRETSLDKCNLEGADVTNADISGASLQYSIGLTTEQLTTVKALEGTKMDEILTVALKSAELHVLEQTERAN